VVEAAPRKGLDVASRVGLRHSAARNIEADHNAVRAQ
jgi:hypothetical protein